ncbi:MAG: hypothetical protein CME15_10990 [Gemmatimonadetes bacterium]|nr:hypothetical protein [Gemmatimonadota bacterium]
MLLRPEVVSLANPAKHLLPIAVVQCLHVHPETWKCDAADETVLVFVHNRIFSVMKTKPCCFIKAATRGYVLGRARLREQLLRFAHSVIGWLSMGKDFDHQARWSSIDVLVALFINAELAQGHDLRIDNDPG